jgi:undecaprenyl-diphosphatase
MLNSRRYQRGYLGRHLIIGFLLFAAMTVVLGEISEDIRNGEPLTIADARINDWLHEHRSPHLTSAFLIVTSLGASYSANFIAGIVGLYLLWKRQLYWLVAVWSSVFGGMLLNWYLKFIFHRPRPRFDDPILSLTSYSFPSGHTMTATVLYGVMAALLITMTDRRSIRVLIVLLASFLIGLVGFSRMYLGAHYLSDVLGAIAEGVAWLALCLTTVYSVWRHRNQ